MKNISLAFLLTILFKLVVSPKSLAQLVPPQVPSKMKLGNLELIITDEAKEIIQKDINNLTKNENYFYIKAEKATWYFPLMEKILKEEGIPDDFKYLALQESSLTPNAVSASNAVGYWQFKEETAKEIGLTIDENIDERMHIVFSTRAAARYFKKNNSLLNNWVYTLLSYNLGLGGVKASINPGEISGVEKIEITNNTHWYITRFLAHKIAFEKHVPQNTSVKLTIINNIENKTLDELAYQWKLDPHQVSYYNAWLKTKKIPTDYSIIIPTSFDKPITQPDKVEYQTNKWITKNGLKCITAKKDDTPYILAMEAGISEKKLRRYNDLKKYDDIIPGMAYYIEPKYTEGTEDYYTVLENETLWEIGQKLGIKKSRLTKYNRLHKLEDPVPGRVLWIRDTRPVSIPIEVKKTIPDEEKQTTSYYNSDQKISLEEVKEDQYNIGHINSEGVKDNDTESIKTNTTPIEYIHTPDSINTVKKDTSYYHKKTDSTTTYSTYKQSNSFADTPKTTIDTTFLKNKGATLHTVQTGENLYQIAKRYKTTIEKIQLWNNKNKEDYTIKIGEKLIIYPANRKLSTSVN